MKKHHIGLVGCGRWGKHILRDLRSLNCEVTVVARSDQSRKNAIEGGARAVVDSVARLPSMDGVIVATTIDTHASVIEQLVDLKIPIFSEKPLTADPTSANRLAEVAPNHLFVMDKWRYHPGIEMLGRIARSKELGPVLGLRTMRVQWGLQHHDSDCIWVMAPHDLSIALEVLGSIPTPQHAVAECVGETPVGLVGILGSDPWFCFEVSTRYPENRREVRLHCQGGIAVLRNPYVNHVEVTRSIDLIDTAIPDAERRPISTEWPLLRQLRVFIEYLSGGSPPKSSVAEGATIVNTLATLRELAGLENKGAKKR